MIGTLFPCTLYFFSQRHTVVQWMIFFTHLWETGLRAPMSQNKKMISEVNG
jgi:hypothetical protein